MPKPLGSGTHLGRIAKRGYAAHLLAYGDIWGYSRASSSCNAAARMRVQSSRERSPTRSSGAEETDGCPLLDFPL